jgi:DNA-binding MarR family transcriptional regulator
MTDTTTLTGQDIGRAHYATRAVLEAALAQTGTSFSSWLALNAVATAGTVATEAMVVHRLVDGLKIDASPARGTIDELVAAGLVRRSNGAGSDVELVLTADGEARVATIQAAAGALTERLYADLATEDLAVAQRILATVTARANEELAR